MRRKYHLNSPLWPKFAINGDNVDGNIPSTRVKNWSHLVEIINEDALFDHTDQVLFRGQRHSHWGLTPSIARLLISVQTWSELLPQSRMGIKDD